MPERGPVGPDAVPSVPIPPSWVMAGPRLIQGLGRVLARSLQPAGLSLFERLLQVYATRAMATAARLDIAALLDDQALDSQGLAARCACHPATLDRLLRALASQGIFRLDRRGRWRNTRLSRALRPGPGSARELAISHMGDEICALMADFEATLASGESPAARRYGTGIFTALDSRPELASHFNQAMADSSALSAATIMAAYDFGKHRALVDVGGGTGTLARALAARYPRLAVRVFDRPATVADFRIPEGLAGRLSAEGGDFFEAVPEGGDCYVLKNILHDWDDESCVRLLRVVARAMAPQAHLLIVDSVLRPGNHHDLGKLADLLMLMACEGGRERRKDEFAALLAAAGFKLERVIPTVAPFSVLLARPVSGPASSVSSQAAQGT